MPPKKKVENHPYTLAIYFMQYNFAPLHSSILCNPAIAAGVATDLMDLGGMADVLEACGALQPVVTKTVSTYCAGVAP